MVKIEKIWENMVKSRENVGKLGKNRKKSGNGSKIENI